MRIALSGRGRRSVRALCAGGAHARTQPPAAPEIQSLHAVERRELAAHPQGKERPLRSDQECPDLKVAGKHWR
jgi:hypothetical protein